MRSCISECTLSAFTKYVCFQQTFYMEKAHTFYNQLCFPRSLRYVEITERNRYLGYVVLQLYNWNSENNFLTSYNRHVIHRQERSSWCEFCMYSAKHILFVLFDVRVFVHPSIIHKEIPTRCNSVWKFYFLFIWSSTCFERHTAHHQESKTALAASGFAYVEGCWTCSCWTLSGRVCSRTYSTWQRLPPIIRSLKLH